MGFGRGRPVEIARERRDGEGGSVGRAKVGCVAFKDAVSDFSRINDAAPRRSLFGRSIVGRDLELGDERSICRFEDVFDLKVAKAKFLGTTNSLKNFGIVEIGDEIIKELEAKHVSVFASSV